MQVLDTRAGLRRRHNHRGTPTKRSKVSVMTTDGATVNCFKHCDGLVNNLSQGVVELCRWSSGSPKISHFGTLLSAVARRPDVPLTIFLSEVSEAPATSSRTSWDCRHDFA